MNSHFQTRSLHIPYKHSYETNLIVIRHLMSAPADDEDWTALIVAMSVVGASFALSGTVAVIVVTMK